MRALGNGLSRLMLFVAALSACRIWLAREDAGLVAVTWQQCMIQVGSAVFIRHVMRRLP